DAYAFRLADRLRSEGFRAELVDASTDSLGSRIRRAKLQKVPYVLVVGDEDADAGTVGVNRRGSEEPERGVRVVDLFERLATAVTTRSQDGVSALKSAYTPDGINAGLNIGRPAGAGVPGHVHVHVLPRWTGDTNFMTTVAETRVLPEDLRTSWEKVRAAWPKT